jgi:hypothetical protein
MSSFVSDEQKQTRVRLRSELVPSLMSREGTPVPDELKMRVTEPSGILLTIGSPPEQERP